MKDLKSNVKALRAISPAAILAGNGTLTSEIIDTKDFGSLLFAIMSGVLTDGTYTCDLYEGDESNMSDEAAVVAADMIGQVPAFTFAATEDNTVKKVGYIGSKRYVRLKIVQSGATTGGYINAVAIQGHPKSAPVA